MKFKKIVKEKTRKEFNDWLRRNGFPGGKPKGQREWDSVTRSIRASKKAGEPRYKCDDIVDYDGEEWTVKGSWVREDKGENEYKLTNMDGTETIYVLQSEIENPMHESKEKRVSKEEDNWYGIKDATFIYHGDYSDPEVEYKGVSLNYWAIQDGLWEVFKDENPEGTEKEFDKWMETHPEEVKSELELQYDAEIGNQDDELEEFDEGWLGDKMKAGWEKVKSGAKKVGKAIGDAFNGPFRKGDQIVMKGEDGESFKGTITDYSMSDRTYEVMLGKQTNEGLEEDVLDMPDRVEELENEIEKLWVRLGDLPADKNEVVLNLISNYVELEQLEPGRVDFEESTLMNEETREEIAYLKSIGEYDDYKKMIRALKAKNAKKKSTKKPAKRKWGGASKKSARKPISRPAAKKEYKYSFSASGYGTKTYSFPSEEECLKEMKQDAEATALDYGGEVQWWDDKECVVVDGDGQELGTFEYLGARR